MKNQIIFKHLKNYLKIKKTITSSILSKNSECENNTINYKKV